MAGDSYDIILSIMYIYISTISTFIHSMNPAFRNLFVNFDLYPNQSHGKLAAARHSHQEAIQSTTRWRSDPSTIFVWKQLCEQSSYVNQEPELQEMVCI